MAQDGEKLLREMLAAADIKAKASYNPREVCRILGVHYHTFRKMCREFEMIDDKPKPGTLDSYYVRGERRVTFPELARYIYDNNAYRLECAISESQLNLFGE